MNVLAPAPIPVPTPAALKIKPPSVCLVGNNGTGKTYALTTAIEAGLELFVIITEPNGLDTILDSMRDKNLPMDRLHWAYVEPMKPGWTALIEGAKRVNVSSYEDISNLKQGVNKSECTQFIKLLETCANFVDERTGQAFGPVEKWGADRCLALDSLSGVNDMAWSLTVGLKSAGHMGEWGVAMNVERSFIHQLCSSLNCFFVMTAHLEKEINLVEGGTELTLSCLGAKNAPKIGRYFSEIAMAKRNKDGKFFWSTADMQAALKHRGLKFSGELQPSLREVYNVHQSRLKQAGQEALTPPQL